MAGKAARGAGTIRKKTVTRSGKAYTYWEARVTTGRDPGTGKQVQISITGKTQKEVREKLQAAAVAVDSGTYIQPERMTVSEWLDIWTAEYLGGVKPNTARIYRNNVKRHIKPALGAVRLPELRPHMIQAFINRLELAPASVRLAYKVLYQALKKAVALHYIPQNPAEGCTLPRLEQEEIKPMDDKQITALLNATQGTEVEQLIKTALFTGCRLSELLGLTWDCVGRDTITISKQLARPDQRADGPFISPKNGKSRTLTPAPLVLDALKAQKRMQTAARIKAGPLWDNAYNLVFTTETGAPVSQWKIERVFSKILAAAELHGIRFHDLRHTYAVNAIRAGDDIKTVQGNLGHASAAFTLDRYGHFTERMKQDSAARMEGFIRGVLNL
ncbi:tyrosine-type recombinase/integrase [Ruthenibacterium lactatiformans]|uniref:tyrosine-type recombinase/integrase n=1 Tax=Ruthenibacterium lactatiformans TaxID=1550024 RepID=UPI0039A0BD11